MWGLLVFSPILSQFVQQPLQSVFKNVPVLGELFSGPPVVTGRFTARGRPRRSRLEGVQRRAKAPRGRPGWWAGQADREDLPARPSRVGHPRGDRRRVQHARDRRRSELGRAIEPGAAVAAAPAGRPRTRADHGTDGRRAGCMKVLVAESVAREGIDLLRTAGHEVDERIGLPREELAAIMPEYDALIVRSQVAGRRRARSPPAAARGHRPGRRRRRQRRPRRCDEGRHHRRQRADRQHDRCRRAHPGAALRRRAPDGGRRRAPATGRMEARASSPASSCAAGRWGSSGSARSARPSRIRARAMEMDGPRGRPVRDRRGRREPRGRTRRPATSCSSVPTSSRSTCR